MLDARIFIPGPAYFEAMNELLQNPQQLDVFNSKGNCVVLAGPGSGKTKCLTVKLARILSEDLRPPQGVACITYSTECVRHLRRQLAALGVRESPYLFIGTVHAFCLKYLVVPYAELAKIEIPRPVLVASKADRSRKLEAAIGSVFHSTAPSGFHRLFHQARRGEHSDVEITEEVRDVIDAYVASLRKDGKVDFDDISQVALKLVIEHQWVRSALCSRFPILAVDEYQDLGAPLHNIVTTLLATEQMRVIAVGDVDQSIYGFNGANPELLSQLAERRNIEVVRLRFNYRCGKTIIAASEAALGEARDYEAKSSVLGTVDFHLCDGGLRHQADFACRSIIPQALSRMTGRSLGDIAVLYYDRYIGDEIARAASEHGFPVQRLDKGGPYEKTPLIRWLEDCAAWCADGWRVVDPYFPELLTTWRGFGSASLTGDAAQVREFRLTRFLSDHRSDSETVREWLRSFSDACLREALQEPELADEREALVKLWTALKPGGALEGMSVREFGGQRGSRDHLNLVTLHSAKGLEFQVVIILGLDNGILPTGRVGQDIREERRLFYVGLTRAKHEVHLTYSGFAERFGRRSNRGPSVFLDEVRTRLLKE